ncbi:MAG: hypothetical protein ACQEXJ_24380 [Myxococcota bacterium]
MRRRRRAVPVALGVLLLVGCGGREVRDDRPEPGAAEAVAEMVGLSPQDEEGRALARELAADWSREAGDDEDRAAVLALLRSEFREALEGRDASARRALLRAEVVERRVRALGRRSLALAEEVDRGALSHAEATPEAEDILAGHETLLERVRGLRDAERRRLLSRDLQEILLEATFAMAGGARSHRMGPGEPPSDAPPDVR